MKQVALGGGNWPFIGSAAAGERAADFFTLVSSAIRNELDVWVYLKYVMHRPLAGVTNSAGLRPTPGDSRTPKLFANIGSLSAATAPTASSAAAPPAGAAHPS